MNKRPVFVHIPKTGGASVLQICLRYKIMVIDHNLRDPNHVSLQEYRSVNKDIYSFAIVRNPWDRVVSAYHFLKSGGIKGGDKVDVETYVNKYNGFSEFVLGAFEDNNILEQIHFRPQYLWISQDGRPVVDMLGRFEKLDLHVSRWLKTIGMPACKLPHVNKGIHRSYKQYYDKQTIDVIRRVYSTDIELFKYQF